MTRFLVPWINSRIETIRINLSSGPSFPTKINKYFEEYKWLVILGFFDPMEKALYTQRGVGIFTETTVPL